MTQDKEFKRVPKDDPEYLEYMDSIHAYKTKIARWDALVEALRPQGEELGHDYHQVAGMIAQKEGWYDADIDAYAKRKVNA